jgi:hypothetical protein
MLYILFLDKNESFTVIMMLTALISFIILWLSTPKN